MKPSDSGFCLPLEIKEEWNYEYTNHFNGICGDVGYVLYFVYLKYPIWKSIFQQVDSTLYNENSSKKVKLKMPLLLSMFPHTKSQYMY